MAPSRASLLAPFVLLHGPMNFGSAAVIERSMQHAVEDSASTCLRRMSSVERAEGYSTLCTSLASLYQEHRGTENAAAALRAENNRLQAEVRRLTLSNKELSRQASSQLAERQTQEAALAEALDKARAEMLRMQDELQRLKGREPDALLKQIRALSAENARLVDAAGEGLGCAAAPPAEVRNRAGA
eukprot:CAMPEP_0170404026 /NCGR_PEP_ID=MMETSP0117_2-20130122/26413_1 /TAXON_ID=400756 /ORGANISM="Durinskia baltica, Strain CSIRO CS-38" /LENGTH=185 /DNA_ID=CAMNT_0010661017 /DNA_START=31 /DNA_END=586 /DNA_ORIENTATION=-